MREGPWDCFHLLRASQPMGGLADAVMLQLGISLGSSLSGLELFIHPPPPHSSLPKSPLGINKIPSRTEPRWVDEHTPEVQCCL